VRWDGIEVSTARTWSDRHTLTNTFSPPSASVLRHTPGVGVTSTAADSSADPAPLQQISEPREHTGTVESTSARRTLRQLREHTGTVESTSARRTLRQLREHTGTVESTSARRTLRQLREHTGTVESTSARRTLRQLRLSSCTQAQSCLERLAARSVCHCGWWPGAQRMHERHSVFANSAVCLT
jgi:hypothetical protein